MPGCKIADDCFVIAQYSEVPYNTVGTFHVVVAPCACNTGWWTIKAHQPCVGHIGAMHLNGQAINLVTDIPRGQCHCAPDACLQPIRPGKKLDETPAPPKELVLDHQPSKETENA